MPVTRRRFLQASAAAAATTALDPSAFAKTPDGPNVVLFIVDSLRADAVYERRGPHAQHGRAACARGCSFTSAYPEAMPTVPGAQLDPRRPPHVPLPRLARLPGLLDSPGWAPLHARGRVAHERVLRRAGYWTAYVTDNPFLGFSLPYAPVRHSVHRFVRTGGQIGGNKPVSSVPAQGAAPLAPPLDHPRRSASASASTSPTAAYWHDEPDSSFAARVFRNAVDELDARPPTARRSRWSSTPTSRTSRGRPPRRYLDLYGDRLARPRAGDAAATTRTDNWLGRGERGPVAAPACSELYAAEVTMTDRLARRLPRPPPRPEPRARHRRSRWSATTASCSASTAGRARSRPRSTRRSRACR